MELRSITRGGRRGARALALLALLGGTAVAVGGCGSQEIELAKSNPDYPGAVLFLDNCSGCHSISVVGAEGSATTTKDRLPTNGPNFNYRKVTMPEVLYAIRNGGFSGAIMPQNIVVGEQAEEVASFLSKYSGREATHVPSTNIHLSLK